MPKRVFRISSFPRTAEYRERLRLQGVRSKTRPTISAQSAGRRRQHARRNEHGQLQRQRQWQQHGTIGKYTSHPAQHGVNGQHNDIRRRRRRCRSDVRVIGIDDAQFADVGRPDIEARLADAQSRQFVASAQQVGAAQQFRGLRGARRAGIEAVSCIV